MSWQTGYPPDNRPVLAVAERKMVLSGGATAPVKTVIRAQYIRQKEVEAESWDDNDGIDEYCEEDDMYYIRAGWYELIDYWEEYGFVAVDDPVTHWMPMPKVPE